MPMPMPLEMPTPTPTAPPAIDPVRTDTAPAAIATATLAAAAPAQTPAHVKILRPVQPPAVPDTLPSFMRETDAPLPGTGLSRWQRWAVAAGGGAVLIAIALALFAELRDSGSYDHIVLTLPQSGDHAGGHAGDQARASAEPAPGPLAAQEATQAAASLPAAQQADNGAPDLHEPAAMPPAAAHAAAPAARSIPASAPARANYAAATTGSAAYRLQIQPWGVVYVDGVDRGVSPPVKRLVLAPGRHTIRIANPNFHDRVLEVDTSAGSGQIAINFSDEPR
jgi:hypothetical protein